MLACGQARVSGGLALPASPLIVFRHDVVALWQLGVLNCPVHFRKHNVPWGAGRERAADWTDRQPGLLGFQQYYDLFVYSPVHPLDRSVVRTVLAQRHKDDGMRHGASGDGPGAGRTPRT